MKTTRVAAVLFYRIFSWFAVVWMLLHLILILVYEIGFVFVVMLLGSVIVWRDASTKVV